MSQANSEGMWAFIKENSLLLILGTFIALWWANTNYEGYQHFAHTVILTNDWVGELHGEHRVLTVHYLINDVLMALFFAIAGKEVWEAIALQNGSLRGRQALTPVIATAGGVIGPIVVYLTIAGLLGALEEAGNGWAIPTATDIAFSYLVGKWVFGKNHPAVAFLLLLAIVDDAVGLVLIAAFYPKGEIQLVYLMLPVVAMLLNYFVFNRWLRILNFWPYLIIGGSISWLGFQLAGIHPALGLLPIIPTMPHADSDPGFFAQEEEGFPDTLNAFEHRMGGFVQLVLFGFALANAGVVFSAVGDATWLVLAGLGIGKPFGILLFGLAGIKLFGLSEGMRKADLFVVGWVAALGFTVALFVAGSAFPEGAVRDAAKTGALMSFFFAAAALLTGRLCRVQRVN